MNFLNTFTQVLILFILILVGYYIRYKNLIDKEFTSKLSKLILSVFLPAMIINSMQIDFDSSVVNKILTLLLISVVMYIISFIIAYCLKFIFKYDKDLGIYQYGIIFSNVGFMGYPVIESILGSEAIFYTAIFNLPFNVFIMTIGVYILCKENSEYKFSIKSFINPAIVSIFIGLILFISRIKLPIFINDTLNLLGDVTTPLSMLVIGSMICESSYKECFSNKKLYIVTLIRLILLPICIYLILKLRIKDSLLLSIPVIISSMPIATNTAIMANEYNVNTSLASQAVFLSTLCSVVTIPLVSFILLN